MNANDLKLKTIIDDMANQGDREITKAMFVLISALTVGPVLDRLVSETGYPQQFVGPIVNRMQQVGLWGKDFIIKPVFLRHCYFVFARNSGRITCWALPLSIWATNWPRRVAAHNLNMTT